MSPWIPRSRFHRPPPWWPADEPWPSRGSRFNADRRRERFSRRTGWYSFVPIWLLLWLVVSVVRGRFAVAEFPVSGAIAVLMVCAVAAGVVAVVIRRIAGPVADIVGAADRIRRRDYRVRVSEPAGGPRWVGDTARAFNAMARELEAQDEARRNLMADVAHELRTPLAVVQGKLEGLIDGVYPADADQLQGLLENTRVLSRLVEDLRTLATAESGALALAREPTDIVALANDVAAFLLDRAESAGVRLRVETERAEEIEPIAVDALRIREVLINLVTNALRYTPRGGGVTVTIGAQPPASQALEIRVADTGAGIAADDVPRIFDRFYKGAESSGSGLGLTIARRLVEAHGGTIRAESKQGAGTTIAFVLPR